MHNIQRRIRLRSKYCIKGTIGRPTAIQKDPLLFNKLRAAFLIGATKKEAAIYAGINYKTLYEYLKADEDLNQQVEGWRQEPTLKAKRTVINNIEADVGTAKWWLERTSPEEFGVRSKIQADITARKAPLTEEEITKLKEEMADSLGTDTNNGIFKDSPKPLSD